MHNPKSDRSEQRESQRWHTPKTNFFPSSKRLVAVLFIYDNYDPYQDAQIHVSIINNSFGIIIEVKCQDRGIVSNNQRQQQKISILWTSRHLCVHRWPLSFISQRSNPCVYLQKLLCKYDLARNYETRTWTVNYFIDIFIEVGGETNT